MATTHLPPPLRLPNGRPLHEQANIDGLALPHVFSFASILGGASHTYWHDRFDEAMRHARENALAMRRDCYLMSLLQERKLAVSSLPWYLEVPDPRDPVQAAARANLTQTLRGTRGFRRMVLQWLEAIWFGRSGVQVEWCWKEIEGRRALSVKQWSPLQGDKIGHHWDGVPYVLVNSTHIGDMKGAELVNTTRARALRLSGGWRERFLLHASELDDADFFEGEAGDARYGVGIRSRIYWLDYLKREYMDWVVTYLERVGLGVSIWRYDASDPTAKAKAEEAAKENSRRTNITVPVWPDSRDGMVGGFERVETPTGGIEVLREMIGALDAYIERYVVGQSGSAHGEAAGLGNEAAHEFMSNTKDAIRDHDAHLLAESITGDESDPGMISLMQRYSYPETMPDKPNGFPVLFKFGLEKSLNNERVGVILKLVSMGVPVKLDDLYNAAGISRPEPHDDIVIPPAPEPVAGAEAGPPGHGKPGGNPDKPRPPGQGKPPPGGPRHAGHAGDPLTYAEGEDDEPRKGVWRPGGGQYVYGRRKPPARDLLAYAEDEEPDDDALPLDTSGHHPLDDEEDLNTPRELSRREQTDSGPEMSRVRQHRSMGEAYPETGPNSFWGEDGKLYYAADEPDPDDLLSDEEPEDEGATEAEQWWQDYRSGNLRRRQEEASNQETSDIGRKRRTPRDDEEPQQNARQYADVGDEDIDPNDLEERQRWHDQMKKDAAANAPPGGYQNDPEAEDYDPEPEVEPDQYAEDDMSDEPEEEEEEGYETYDQIDARMAEASFGPVDDVNHPPIAGWNQMNDLKADFPEEYLPHRAAKNQGLDDYAEEYPHPTKKPRRKK